MILSIMDVLKDVFGTIKDFVLDNYDNYIFWGIIAVIILVIGYFAISKFSNK